MHFEYFEYIDPNCLSRYAKTFNWANHSIYRNIKLHNFITKHTANILIDKKTTVRGIIFPMPFQYSITADKWYFHLYFWKYIFFYIIQTVVGTFKPV